MGFFNDKTFSAILIIMLVAFALLSCTPTTLQTQGPKQPNTMESVAKMKSVGSIIGCVFAPNDPVCEEMRTKKTDTKPHLSQKEYDDQNNKDWEKVD